MKNIGQTMDKADRTSETTKSEADISIVERIVRKTGNRKLAAVLALDLFLVGVDTVREEGCQQCIDSIAGLSSLSIINHQT